MGSNEKRYAKLFWKLYLINIVALVNVNLCAPKYIVNKLQSVWVWFKWTGGFHF